MFFIVLVLFIVCTGMPLAYSWRVARLNLPTKGAWLIHVAESSVLVALVFLVGRWDMAGYYMRLLLSCRSPRRILDLNETILFILILLSWVWTVRVEVGRLQSRPT